MFGEGPTSLASDFHNAMQGAASCWCLWQCSSITALLTSAVSPVKLDTEIDKVVNTGHNI